MKDRAKRKKCSGCRNEFYHAGNNPLGVKQCWSFKDAKVVWKCRYESYEPMGQKRPARRVLDCYHVDGAVYVNKR